MKCAVLVNTKHFYGICRLVSDNNTMNPPRGDAFIWHWIHDPDFPVRVLHKPLERMISRVLPISEPFRDRSRSLAPPFLSDRQTIILFERIQPFFRRIGKGIDIGKFIRRSDAAGDENALDDPSLPPGAERLHPLQAVPQ